MSKNESKFRILREKIENVLNEHFTANPALNAEIESRLSQLELPMKMYVRDAIETLYNAGKPGYSVNAWRKAVQGVYENTPEAIADDDLSKILGTAVRIFSEHIFNNKRTRIVRWYDEPMPPDARSAMVQSIELASECLKVITDAPEPITLDHWANIVATNLQYPTDMVKGYIEIHMIPHMGSAISKTADGRYFIQKDEKQNSLELFNKIASGEIIIPLEDQ
jgi:hypothetical protein